MSERYHRQIILKGFGEKAQEELLSAKVLVVGAGGLGCPALQYLAAAGVGTLGIVDSDVVAISNLPRQILYSPDDVGESKALKAAQALKRLNPDTNIVCYNVRLTAENVADIINTYDLILDGSDNFATRYLINDAAVLLQKIVVSGAVSQYEGQLAIFNCKTTPGKTPVNYRDLFPSSPSNNEILNCEEAGVLGVVPGIIGTMMANEAIKIITNTGTPAIDKLITYNSQNNQFYEIDLVSKEETQGMIPSTAGLLKSMNYESQCSNDETFEITPTLFSWLLENTGVVVVDIREEHEMPKVDQFEYLSIPVSQLEGEIGKLEDDTVILFCQTGKRSVQAAQRLQKLFGESRKILSLQGGIRSWLAQQKEAVL